MQSFRLVLICHAPSVLSLQSEHLVILSLDQTETVIIYQPLTQLNVETQQIQPNNFLQKNISRTCFARIFFTYLPTLPTLF